jgi:predicted lipoprotein with Yx(FWY)xxD motif
MIGITHHTRSGRRWRPIVLATGLAATTALLIGVAAARTLTLGTASNATVTNQSGATSHATIVVTSRGAAVYELSGDSARHLECTQAKGCFKVWPPVTISATATPTKAPNVRGRLGVLSRNGLHQLTLDGHPLYRYAFDSRARAASGDGIRAFGGVWHVVRLGQGSTGSTTPTPTTTPTTPTTPTMPPQPCLYPPCY